MKCRYLLLLPFLLCLFPAASAAEAFTYRCELNTYIETKIVISYAFTNNVTSDAFSLGQSVWQVNIDPLVTTFTTSAADKFIWHLRINYNLIISQTVTVAVFSGNEAIDTLEFDVKTDQLILDFDITVTEQPRPPTPEELAELTIDRVTNELSQQNQRLLNTLKIVEQTIVLQWIALAIFAAVDVLLVWKLVLKKPAYEERE